MFTCIVRGETHCIRHVISRGGTHRKLLGKYNEPPDPDRCAYPLRVKLIVIREFGYHLGAGLRGLLGENTQGTQLESRRLKFLLEFPKEYSS